jgi:glycosyltransferase involved in cell wall biosynthesis
VPQPSLVESTECDKHKYEDGFHILYCGNLGIIQLIDLIPLAMKEVTNPNIKFHVIGMGPKEAELKSLIKEHHLEDKVFYHGPMPANKAAPYFKGADALYISLKGDGYVGKTLPNKLMMSMVFKKPLIGVLKGDGRDALVASNGGLIAEENPKDIALKIETLANMNQEERKKLGENNQVYYQKNYSLAKVSELIESFLKVF